jgi:AcrR family transcriptional regulator
LQRYAKRIGPVNTRQQIAAEQTQRVIVEAAAKLFLDGGYHATSIGQIAAQAGVAVQTIYNSIGSKREVLSRVLDFAAADERAPASVPQFMGEQSEREADPIRIIEQLVEFWLGALPRTAPVLRVMREAAGIDPGVATLERDHAVQRLCDYEAAARLLDERGALRDGLTIDQAAAAIFAIGHPETYRTLVLEGSWDGRRWAEWARTALAATLIEP